MKLNQLNGCKTLARIAFCAILLVYCHNLCKTYFHFYWRLNGTNFTASAEESTEKEVTTVKRIKRFLIFQGGGVVKLVLGASFPIKMADKTRSLSYFYNFQMQYAPPTIPLYWWSIYNTTTFAARRHTIEKFIHFDKSRDFVYEFIKTTLTRTGNSANGCVLNVICKLARTPFLEDFSTAQEVATQQSIGGSDEKEFVNDCGINIYHRLLNAIFIPVHSNVKEQYLDARKAGQSGANCDEMFGKCPIAEKWFKNYTKFI